METSDILINYLSLERAAGENGIRPYSTVFQKLLKNGRIPYKIFFAPRIHHVGSHVPSRLPSEAPSLRAGVWACRLSRLVAVAFVCLRAPRPCHVLVDLIHVVLFMSGLS